MVRMILSHCTGICESREESKKKRDVQKVGQGKRAASDLPRSLMQREWISSTKVLILNCGNPFLLQGISEHPYISSRRPGTVL